MSQSYNRKLLVSVFDPQETREAIAGGGRIIDSEDPRSALGNIKPNQIMNISNAALQNKRDLEVQLSTNIGEDQLLFDRSENGEAIPKSAYEIAGKAAQAALGVACAMGTRVHESAIIKIGVDGMKVDLLKEVIAEIVTTLKRTEQYQHNQVMSVLFAQDLLLWQQRKDDERVRQVLMDLGEYYMHKGEVTLNTLFPHHEYFSEISENETRTTKDVIKTMVDATADSGADSIMLDTRIQTKVARVSLVKTGDGELVDINQFDMKDGLARDGILKLDELKFFVEYCHYRNIEANVAGSIQSYQAQQLWLEIPKLDQISTRGAASATVRNPAVKNDQTPDTRQHRIIKSALVRGLAAPEHGGVLNIPSSLKYDATAMLAVNDLRKRLASARKQQGLPPLQTYFVDQFANTELLG